ncbi:hypothetical protein BC938DRAFT_474675 [Jimgerdemannia flammicorona]|uniref:BTB domain-containing protein n=1 Tax=Jimgerdemannia flammicorona TaxID=994334 RepID=A0A433QS84_9FUNG|nr:hypothetical protein BC938DRAFT_474675 [Jimgerdemannia flammicorona]
MKTTALSTSSHVKPEIRANHYYDDGNVILCVDNAHFRVHASILRLSSSYFENLLPEFLSETDPQNNNNACPHQDYTATGANSEIEERGDNPEAGEPIPLPTDLAYVRLSARKGSQRKAVGGVTASRQISAAESV